MKNKIVWIVIATIVLTTILLLTSDHEISATEMMERKNYNEEDAKKAILHIKQKYGLQMAQTIEKMMRLETNHFKSGQYKLTGSAGMEVGKWSNIPSGATAGYVSIDDVHKVTKDENGKSIPEKFIVWNSVTDFAEYLAEYIKRYNGNFARWNALDPNLQAEYKSRVATIKSRFV